MIVQGIITAVLGTLGGFFSVLPTITLPVWLQGGTDYTTCGSSGLSAGNSLSCNLHAIGQEASGVSAWLPIDQAMTAALLVLSVFGVIVTVKLVRICISMFSGGGGSAS